MDYMETAKRIISWAIDQVGIEQQNCGVDTPEFQELKDKVDRLCRAHQVLDEEGFLNKAGRVVVKTWLYNNVEGVHPEDVSEAADQVFNGDLAVIGGLYMLINHSWGLQRSEDGEGIDWE